MTGVKSTVYQPNKKAANVYAELYTLYRQLHDAFGLPGAKVSLDRRHERPDRPAASRAA